MTYKVYIEIAGGNVEAVYTDLPAGTEFTEIDLDIPDTDCNMLSGSVVMGLEKLDPDVLIIQNSTSLRKVRAAKKRLLGIAQAEH